MINTIQPYAWGSRSAMSDLFGFSNPHDEPMAELWMGAHPKAPSRVLLGDADLGGDAELGLDEYIARDPVSTLGSKLAAGFGDELPYLFKVLSAAQGLSIQAHPNREQAKEGFEREEKLGIPRDHPKRNYKDKNHKPEVLVALTEFWALRGFRRINEIVVHFDREGLGPLRQRARELSVDGDLRRFFQALFDLTADERSAVLASLLGEAHEREGTDSDAPEYRWIRKLSKWYQDDIGVLAPLYLNLLRLEPGEAVFQPAGVLHAYLSGTGVECMANSDNVLRGGCTVKHIDREELIRVLDFAPRPPEKLASEAPGASVASVTSEASEGGRSGDPSRPPTDTEAAVSMRTFVAGVPEFELEEILLGSRALEPSAGASEGLVELSREGGADIILCASGEVRLASSSGEVRLAAGESVFLTDDVGHISLGGHGQVFRARPGAAIFE
jgi:mannose-6-phosphate isomerase